MPIPSKLSAKIIIRSSSLTFEKPVGFHPYAAIPVDQHKKCGSENGYGCKREPLPRGPHAHHSQRHHGCNNSIWKEEWQPWGKIDTCQIGDMMKCPRCKCRQ